jgi:DNA-binding response OmpR family regulator
MNKIFLVDDDFLFVKLCTKFLEFKGLDVIDYAINGIEAVNKFLHFKNKPDLIIMDCHMPYKDGIETTIELLKLDGNIKIFLISGDPTIKKEALAAGALDFKEKPFNLQELYNTILTLIRNNSDINGSKIYAL